MFTGYIDSGVCIHYFNGGLCYAYNDSWTTLMIMCSCTDWLAAVSWLFRGSLLCRTEATVMQPTPQHCFLHLICCDAIFLSWKQITLESRTARKLLDKHASSAGLDIKDCPTALDNWKYLVKQLKFLYPTCPTGQVKFEPRNDGSLRGRRLAVVWKQSLMQAGKKQRVD